MIPWGFKFVQIFTKSRRNIFCTAGCQSNGKFCKNPTEVIKLKFEIGSGKMSQTCLMGNINMGEGKEAFKV